MIKPNLTLRCVKLVGMWMLLSFSVLLHSLSFAENEVKTPRPLTDKEIEAGVKNLAAFDETLELNVYFDVNSDVVKTEYQTMLATLNKTLGSMGDYQFKLSIIGHTDNTADRDYNLALGLRRAEAVKSYLTPKLAEAIVISRIDSKGKDQPSADNSTPIGKALNRRVEIDVSPSALQTIKTGKQVVFSGAGESLLLNEGKQLILWNSEAQCPQSMLSSSENEIYVSAVAPNRLLALSGGKTQKIVLWDIPTSSMISELTGHKSEITALQFSKNSRFAISGSLDGEIRLWDLLKNIQVAKLNGHSEAITAVALSSNGKYAVSGDVTGKVTFWDIVSYEDVWQEVVHDSAVNDISFNELDDAFFSSSLQSGLHIYKIYDENSYFDDNEALSEIVRFDISRDGQQLLSLLKNGDIAIWQTRTGRQSIVIDSQQFRLNSVTYSSGDEIIMASDINAGVHFWDAVTGEYLSNIDTKQWKAKADLPEQGEFDGQVWFDKHSNTEFVWFAPGCYEMGCGAWNSKCSSSEQPVHQVCVDGFWMARNEVTTEQWQLHSRYKPIADNKVDCDEEECLEIAVNHVSWQDAENYICELNKNSGQIYRLPTEAEWEYACRNKGEKIRYYNLEDEENPSALSNMNDGLWEWTLDAFDDDSYNQHRRHSPVYSGDDNFHYMGGNIYRTLRGGAWDKGSKVSQCSRRFYDEPGARSFYTGFRLVRPGK